MKILKGVFFIAIIFFASPNISQAATSITQNTITWTFDGDHEVGQFTNGDYYVVDPGSGVTITSIDPPSVSGARSMNGGMINPGTDAIQGYDEAMLYSTYLDSLNVALDVSSANPLILNSGESLVSSRSQATVGARPQMSDTAILSCLPVAPAPGSFRPPYAGSDKTVKFNISNLDYSDLGNLDPLAGAPSLETYEMRMQKVWYEAMSGWVGQNPRAANHMIGMVNPAYGSDMATWSGQALLLLNCNYSNAQKEALLTYMLQYAIDISGIVSIGGVFNGDGGHGHGRKSILALGAKMFNDPTMINQLNADNYFIFGEDYLIHEITPEYYSTTVCGYNGSFCSTPGVQYNSTDYPLGTPEWTFNGLIANGNALRTATYRHSYGSDIAGMLSALVLGMESAWNRKTSFDYAERFRLLMNEGVIGDYGTYTPGTWVTAMYDAYWETYRNSTSPDLTAPSAPSGLGVL